jgi:DNA-binding LytR/AlgR family response regulator
MKLRVLVVDDEKTAREGLAADIGDIPYLEVAGLAANSFEAFELIHQLQPEIIFLDIDMPGMSGLEFLKILKIKPLVILTTAFREYALESYEFGVLDYLLKPISPERLKLAADKAIDLVNGRTRQNDPREMGDAHIFIKCNGKMERILLAEILYFEAANNYVFIHLKGRRLISYITLKSVEERVSPEAFVRIHKSYIIAKAHIQSIERNIIRINDIEIPVSKNFRGGFKKDVFGKSVRRQ